MTVPEENNFKNVLISIRDRSTSVADDTVTFKRPKKTNFLMPNSHTDSVSPIYIQPKMAYLDDDKTPNFIPGKAVKVISDAKGHSIKEDKVSFCESTYTSLDSYMSGREDIDLYQRRVSAGNVETLKAEVPVKKRCSTTTIRKLNKKTSDGMKKSKSEVSRLCEKMKNVKLKEKDSGRNYKTRSCNDIVKLVLTKHGIHVISDTEAIV